MNLPQNISDQARLTAYALGELDAADAALFEAEIKNDQKALETVSEVRLLAGDLEAALNSETSARVPLGAEPWVKDLPAESKITPFPFWILGTAAAAGFAVMVAVHSTSSSSKAVNAAAAANRSDSVIANTADLRHRLNGSEDFSDVKPAPFREDGLSLGKSVVENRFFSRREGDGGLSVEPSFRNANSAAIVLAKNEFSPSLNYGRASALSRFSSLVYNRDAYAFQTADGFSGVSGFPLSVFFPREGTSSYRNIVSYLQSGRLPPPDAVRVEELLNYFSDRSAASKIDASLAASLEVAAAPWNPSHRLVRIGLTGGNASTGQGRGLTVAKDVKLQVEFNPEQAQSYRLIGYEENAPKMVAASPSKVEGGEMEAGHVVTALYEVVPVPAESPSVDGDPLRYASNDTDGGSRHRELLTLKIHYKLPVADVSRKMEIPLIDPGTAFAVASRDFRFSAAVARFGMILKETPKSAATYDQVLSWAEDSQDKENKSPKQHEFIDLVKKAKTATVE